MAVGMTPWLMFNVMLGLKLSHMEQPREVAATTMLQTMRNTLTEHQQESIPIHMDKEMVEQFQQLAKKMIESQTECKTRKNNERCNDTGAAEPGNEPYQGERYQHRGAIEESPLAQGNSVPEEL